MIFILISISCLFRRSNKNKKKRNKAEKRRSKVDEIGVSEKKKARRETLKNESGTTEDQDDIVEDLDLSKF